MDFSPYLQAIQKIPGKTPGQKYQSLNQIAKKFVSASSDSIAPIKIQPCEEVPEPLVPFVQLEVDRLTKNAPGIVDGLKSDDKVIFDRALKIKWFFNGSMKNYINPEYFKENIFPYISLNNRMKIIKILSNNLTASGQFAIAEEFYTSISNGYSPDQARKLLKGCSEEFIWDAIVKQRIGLRIHEVKYFYVKYPNLIIKYLNLDYLVHRKVTHETLIQTYVKFIPRLLKKHSKEFLEVVNKYTESFSYTMGLVPHSTVSLKPRQVNRLLKQQLENFLKNPKMYLPFLPLRQVIKILNKQQLEQFFLAVMPEKITDRDLQALLHKYLYWVENDDKYEIAQSTFRKLYNVDVLDAENNVVVSILKYAPKKDRIKFARKKLETDTNWYLDDKGWRLQYSWRCYLPTEESIPMIKERIACCQNERDRVALLKQLIFTCGANSDNDALLDVLKYITTRHKNENYWVFMAVLERLQSDFKLENLPLEYNDVIHEFLKFLHIKSQYFIESKPDLMEVNAKLIWNMISAGIHCDLKHNRPISEKMKMLTEIALEYSWLLCDRDCWNVLETVPKYERICIEELSKLIPELFAEHRLENSVNWRRCFIEFVRKLYSFNDSIEQSKFQDLEKLSIKNYPWLFEAVRDAVTNGELDDNTEVEELKAVLKFNEPDLLQEFNLIEAKPKKLIDLKKSIEILKKTPKRVFTNWDKYLKKCKVDIRYKRAHRFLRYCRWFQDLPIMFVERCLQEIQENKDSKSMVVLAVLLEGSVFEKVATPYIPISKIIDPNNEDAKAEYPFQAAIPRALNLVNPPVSLDFVAQFCEADYIHVILPCLASLGRRVAMNKLLPFCEVLIGRPVSIKKHGIRLLKRIVDAKQLRTTLIKLLNTEKHPSTKMLIAKSINDCFRTKPSSDTWKMMEECLDSLTKEDEDVLQSLRKIDSVPGQYLGDYVLKLMSAFERVLRTVTEDGNNDVLTFQEILINEVLNLNGDTLSEDFHEQMFAKFLVNRSMPQYILKSMICYLVHLYIIPSGNKLEHRLTVFSKVFTDIVKDNWDVCQPEKESFYPANYFVQELMNQTVYEKPYNLVKTKLISAALNSFLLVLKPQQSPEFYCTFALGVLYDETTEPAEFADKIRQLLPSLINIFSDQFISAIAKFLHSLISRFFENKLQLDVIERLLAFKQDHTDCLAAALLLLCQDNKILVSDEKFWSIVRTLRKHKHPAVISSAYMALNKRNQPIKPSGYSPFNKLNRLR